VTEILEKQVVFKTDASIEIGTGHVMRCLSLADVLATNGLNCSFVVSNIAEQTVPALKTSRHEVLISNNLSDSKELFSHWPSGVEWFIVDDYRLSKEFESVCRLWAEHIMVIDDLENRKHDCDLLLDQAQGKTEQNYNTLVPECCRFLLGTDYALLREEFSLHRSYSLRRSRMEIKKILVSLGGTDPDDLSSIVLQGLSQTHIKSLEVDVVLGPASPNIKNIESVINSLGLSVKLHIGTENMAELMSSADLAIGAGGISSWERCCMGLPAVLIIVAENQQDNANYLSKIGAASVIDAVSDKITPEVITESVNTFCANPDNLALMSQRSSELCDGQGALRTVEFMLTEFSTA
jgi:UDP-2,4-diacetamido-2,4,6-trideoxy-beta-L-altropyranose hydrolase